MEKAQNIFEFFGKLDPPEHLYLPLRSALVEKVDCYTKQQLLKVYVSTDHIINSDLFQETEKLIVSQMFLDQGVKVTITPQFHLDRTLTPLEALELYHDTPQHIATGCMTVVRSAEILRTLLLRSVKQFPSRKLSTMSCVTKCPTIFASRHWWNMIWTMERSVPARAATTHGRVIVSGICRWPPSKLTAPATASVPSDSGSSSKLWRERGSSHRMRIWTMVSPMLPPCRCSPC